MKFKRKRSPSPRASASPPRQWHSAPVPEADKSRHRRAAREERTTQISHRTSYNLDVESTPVTPSSPLQVRKSSRQRKLSYDTLSTSFMMDDHVIRQRASNMDREQNRTKSPIPSASKGQQSPSPQDNSKRRPNGIASCRNHREREESPQRSLRSRYDSASASELQQDRHSSGYERRGSSRTLSRKSDYHNNHVKFSPSVKPGSPAASRRRDVRNTRLHNLTSEDEQSEFNRRYSRDRRAQRREKAQKKLNHDDDDDETDDNDLVAQFQKEDSDEEDRKTRRTSRRLAELGVKPRISSTEDEDDDDDDEDEVDEDEDENDDEVEEEVSNQAKSKSNNLTAEDLDSSSQLRRSSRNSGGSTSTPMIETAHGSRRAAIRARSRFQENGHVSDEEEEEVQERRRSSRVSNKRMTLNDGDHTEEDSDDDIRRGEAESGASQGLRRSSRRNKLPVDRLNYEPPTRSAASRRTQELRNLDQYSSDEEYQGDRANSGKRRSRYNMRENPRTIRRFEQDYPSVFKSRAGDFNSYHDRSTMRGAAVLARDQPPRRERRPRPAGPPRYRDRDTSSSSSPNNTDDERFQKRKTKRMQVERNKLMPLNLNKDEVSQAIFRDRQKVGASLADVSPMEMDMGVSFDNVGGCRDHINSLKEMVTFPLLYPEIFTKYSITAPRGVLFYGPPGTGKTLMARALACECSRDGKKVAFFMRKGADCMSKWIGESERQLRLLFDQAYVMRPSIIFFDEIDGLAPVRSSRQDQIHSSIVSTLLALMDGLDSRGEVIVIGATNRIENIDPALRRPGRFDRELRFDLPTREARREILGIHTKSWQPALAPSMLDELADKTIGYCGADLKGLCAEAALYALRRRYPQVYSTNQKLKLNMDEIRIRDHDFLKAMNTMVPSTHRVQDQNQSPLPPLVRPLLQASVDGICQKVKTLMPNVGGKDEDGFRSAHNFRPRLLVLGRRGQGLTTYIGPAVLHFLERLPCHKVDIPALYSSSVRTPEEALVHIIHEAKRTIPSVLYLPHVHRLWKVMAESVRETFLSLIMDIPSSANLLIFAVMEDCDYPTEHPEESSLPEHLFVKELGEVISVSNPNGQERRAYFEPIFEKAVAPIPCPDEKVGGEAKVEDLAVLPVEECRSLNEKEEKRLRRKEEHLLRELRIFLREVWGKINRQPKFFMFRSPVNTEEMPDYPEIVEHPMDFDTMLSKLDNKEYSSASAFLADIDLIAENAISYNSDLNYETNKIICHRARALQDFAYALIKNEMDTDFEDNCKGIVERREKLTKQLQQPTVTVPAAAPEQHNDAVEDNGDEADVHRPKKKGSKKRRVTNWARGMDTSRSKRKKRKLENEDGQPLQATADDDDDDEEDEEDDLGQEMTELSASVNGQDNSHSYTLSEANNSKKASPAAGAGCGTPKASTLSQASPTTPTPRRGNRTSLTPAQKRPSDEDRPDDEAVLIDKTKVNNLLSEVVTLTNGWATERIERLYAGLDEAVSAYMTQTDRTQLCKDIRIKIDYFKRLPSN